MSAIRIYPEENINSHTNIRHERNENKVNFIINVSFQTDIPRNLIPLPRSDPNKIFYSTINGETHRRDYVLFRNNKFYCTHCLCFSVLHEKNLFVQGLEYVEGCRISDKLKKHGSSSYHKLAEST